MSAPCNDDRYKVGSGRIVQFSDVHLSVAGKGVELELNYGKDPPLVLLQRALKCARELMPSPDIFLYTGDSVVHQRRSSQGDRWRKEYIRKAIKKVMRNFNSSYPVKGRTKSMTTTVGNADVSPNYYMAITNGNTINPTLSEISRAWEKLLEPVQLNDFRNKGYTLRDIDERLTVLILNTGPYAKNRNGESTNIRLEDPLGQFEWLTTQLKQLESQNRLVYICGHIPPMLHMTDGQYQWKGKYIEMYKAVIAPFVAIIKAQIFGHVHAHEMHLFQLKNVFVPLYTVGAISPKYWNNPSFVVWEYDKGTYEFLDYHVYASTELPFEKWGHLFSATESFGLTNLSSDQLGALSARFKSGNADKLYGIYQKNRYAHAPTKSPECKDAACQAVVACSFEWHTNIYELAECQIKKAKALEDKGLERGGDLRILGVIKSMMESESGDPSKTADVLHPKGDLEVDGSLRLMDVTRVSRVLDPAMETGLAEKPASNIPSTCATAFLAFLLLATIMRVLDKVFGIKFRWRRLVKGTETEKSRVMKLAP